jgi:hypothetical protein
MAQVIAATWHRCRHSNERTATSNRFGQDSAARHRLEHPRPIVLWLRSFTLHNTKVCSIKREPPLICGLRRDSRNSPERRSISIAESIVNTPSITSSHRNAANSERRAPVTAARRNINPTSGPIQSPATIADRTSAAQNTPVGCTSREHNSSSEAGLSDNQPHRTAPHHEHHATQATRLSFSRIKPKRQSGLMPTNSRRSDPQTTTKPAVDTASTHHAERL